MPERLLIIGAGAQARYVTTTVGLTAQAEIVGLLDSFGNPSCWGSLVGGHRILGGLDLLDSYEGMPDMTFVLAIANLAQKRSLAARLEARGCRFATIIHPSAILAKSVAVGAGAILNAGVVCEDSASIGRHAIVHAGSVLEHDTVVEAFVNIGPGVRTAGRVKVRDGAIVYTGATLIPGVEIGREAIVGAGSVVLKAVEAGSVVAGVPARPIKKGSLS